LKFEYLKGVYRKQVDDLIFFILILILSILISKRLLNGLIITSWLIKREIGSLIYLGHPIQGGPVLNVNNAPLDSP